jgi:hypothetical protein
MSDPANRPEFGEQPDLEAMLRAPSPVLPEQEQIISSMAALHAAWYQAWQAAGVPEHRAAEWTGILVREGCSNG